MNPFKKIFSGMFKFNNILKNASLFIKPQNLPIRIWNKVAHKIKNKLTIRYW